MRKRAALCVAVLVLLAATRTLAAGGQKYNIAFLMSLDLGLDTQFRNIMAELAPEMSKKLGVGLTFETYNDEARFFAAIKKGDIDIAYSNDPGVIIALMANHGFVPFATYSMYGKMKKRMCLYASKKGPYKSINDLKGADVLFAPKSLYMYMLLHKLTGGSPMAFYHLKTSEGPSSNIYALSLGETDAIFGSSQLNDYFKITNPGPVKNTQEIACTDEMYSTPIVHTSNVPDAVIAKFTDILANGYKDKDFKKFQPLMNMAKVRFFPVTTADYAADLALYAEIEKKGIDREYRQWERLTLKK